MNKIISILVSGATGKIGSILVDEIKNNYQQYKLSGKYSRACTDVDLKNFCTSSDVIIDFSVPHILKILLREAVSSRIPIVICTTGFSDNDFLLMQDAGKTIPVLYCANSSIGANMLALLASNIAKILNEYDTEIIDHHHKYKKDAPSGTALMIGKQIAKSLNVNFDNAKLLNINEKSNRTKGSIGFSSIRAGNIFGKHEVIFTGKDEQITIEHQVFNRTIFAKGALLGAEWLINHKSGFFLMQDVITEIYKFIS